MANKDLIENLVKSVVGEPGNPGYTDILYSSLSELSDDFNLSPDAFKKRKILPLKHTPRYFTRTAYMLSIPVRRINDALIDSGPDGNSKFPGHFHKYFTVSSAECRKMSPKNLYLTLLKSYAWTKKRAADEEKTHHVERQELNQFRSFFNSVKTNYAELLSQVNRFNKLKGRTEFDTKKFAPMSYASIILLAMIGRHTSLLNDYFKERHAIRAQIADIRSHDRPDETRFDEIEMRIRRMGLRLLIVPFYDTPANTSPRWNVLFNRDDWKKLSLESKSLSGFGSHRMAVREEFESLIKETKERKINELEMWADFLDEISNPDNKNYKEEYKNYRISPDTARGLLRIYSVIYVESLARIMVDFKYMLAHIFAKKGPQSL